MEAVVLVHRPKIEITFQCGGVGSSVEGKDAGRGFAFAAGHYDERPGLPTAQALTLPEMEKRIDVVTRDDILFSRLAVERKHDKKNFIAEQPVLKMPIERKKSGVILRRVRGALLEIKREQGEAVSGRFLLGRASGEVEH